MTHRLQLADAEPGHAPLIRSWADTPLNGWFWSGHDFGNPIDHTRIARHIGHALADPDHRCLLATLNTTPVGYAETTTHHENHWAYLGHIIIDPARRHQGLGRRLVETLCETIFTDPDTHRVELGVDQGNHTALRCYRSAGFRIEGALRERHWWDNQPKDLLTMGLLRPEWETRRQNTTQPKGTPK